MSRWSNFQPCGRPAVRDGLCSLHFRARARRAEKDSEVDEKLARGRALVDEAERLSAALGIQVEAEYFSAPSFARSGHTGRFVVPPDWLRRQERARELLAEIAAAEPREDADHGHQLDECIDRVHRLAAEALELLS